MKYHFQIIVSLCLLLVPCGMFAIGDMEKAEKAYRQKNYVEAANIYESTISKTDGITTGLADTYYNLGNCYFRMKNYGKAVLNYQRSLRIDPSNDDARFNLELTQTKLTDRFDRPTEMFFISWIKGLIASQNSNVWGYGGLACMLAGFILCVLFMLSKRMWQRKVCFFTGLLSFLLLVVCESFAYIQHNRFKHEQLGVVMGTAQTFDTPTPTAKKLSTLHEGTTVTIQSSFEKEWYQIELPDGTTTWIKKSDIDIVGL